MTKILLQLVIAAGILSSVFILTTAYAEICDRPCEAPTIGVLDNGQRIVENGLVISGRAFDVENQIQTIPTMTLNIGTLSKIKLVVYENDGVAALRNVAITISDYQDDKNRNDKARISFNQAFTGAQTVSVMDNGGLLKDATATATQLDEFRTEVVFSFRPVKPVDTSALVVDLWDQDQSSRTNVIRDAVKITGAEIVDFVPGTPSKVPAPLKQVAGGTAPENVKCRAGFELVIRTTGAPACVYPFTAEILRSWGMAS